MKFLVMYALGGGFGGTEMVDGEILEFDSFVEAEDYAFEMACQEYDSYAGLYGLRDINEIMEEEEVDEDEAESIYNNDRESWVDYLVEEVKS